MPYGGGECPSTRAPHGPLTSQNHVLVTKKPSRPPLLLCRRHLIERRHFPDKDYVFVPICPSCLSLIRRVSGDICRPPRKAFADRPTDRHLFLLSSPHLFTRIDFCAPFCPHLFAHKFLSAPPHSHVRPHQMQSKALRDRRIDY